MTSKSKKALQISSNSLTKSAAVSSRRSATAPALLSGNTAKNNEKKDSSKVLVNDNVSESESDEEKHVLSKNEEPETKHASKKGLTLEAKPGNRISDIDRRLKDINNSDVDSDSVSDSDEEEATASLGRTLRGAHPSVSAAAAKAQSRTFLNMSQRMLAAGKAASGNLTSRMAVENSNSKKGAAFVVESQYQKSNAIEAAQASSSLYTADGAGAGSTRKPKSERPKTLGKGWFDIAPAKLDEGLRADMKVVQMRNYLDPKRFYKNPDKMKAVIGVGTVVEGPDEFTTQRISRKDRRQSLVGEILADKSIKEYTKRKYTEIQKEKERTSRKKKKLGQRQGVGSGARKIRKLY